MQMIVIIPINFKHDLRFFSATVRMSELLLLIAFFAFDANFKR